jgi:hypothetical protein
MNSRKRLPARLPIFLAGFLLVCLLVYWITGRDRQPRAEEESPSSPEVAAREAVEEAPALALRQRIDAAELDGFPDLMRLILQGKNSDEQRELVSLLMQRWLVEDLDSFVVFLDEAEVDGLRIWDGLAPGMVEALRSIGGEVADAELLGEVVGRVLLKAAEADPVNALVWAREFLSGENLDTAFAGIAPILAERDPRAAIALFDEVQAFPNQMQAASGIGLALGRSEYALAMTWAESFFSETERAFALSGVLNGMAGRDTDRAAAEYRRVVETMKSRYREQVLADRATSGNTVDEEYEGLSPEEIEKAELAKPNPNLVYLENASRAIALELARQDPLKALDWARSMDLYQGRAVAMETIYEEWGARDPEAAFQSLLMESDRRPEVAGKLFGTWAMKQSRAATASALTLEPGLERDSAIEGVARGWILSGGEPTQIAAWAERLDKVSESDRVRAVLASETAFDQPELAWKQVERISNPLKRSELFQEVFPNLVEENPKLARSALATIQLSPVEIEYFQSMLGP